jgi:acyl carrier protein
MHETTQRLTTYIQHLRPDLTEDEASLAIRSLRTLLDSLHMLAFLCFLEEQFAITLSDVEITPEHFATIEAVSRFIVEKQGLLS